MLKFSELASVQALASAKTSTNPGRSTPINGQLPEFGNPS